MTGTRMISHCDLRSRERYTRYTTEPPPEARCHFHPSAAHSGISVSNIPRLVEYCKKCRASQAAVDPNAAENSIHYHTAHHHSLPSMRLGQRAALRARALDRRIGRRCNSGVGFPQVSRLVVLGITSASHCQCVSGTVASVIPHMTALALRPAWIHSSTLSRE
jgi:hypothetical protein